MRIAARLVAWRDRGFLKPGNGLVPFLLFNQVGPDIVVRVSKLRIQFDRPQAFGDGAVVVAEERVRPPAEGVGLGGREGLDGTAVELDGLLVLALHLQLVSFLKIFSGGLARIVVGHNGPND
jgi:hypothetical protein